MILTRPVMRPLVGLQEEMAGEKRDAGENGEALARARTCEDGVQARAMSEAVASPLERFLGPEVRKHRSSDGGMAREGELRLIRPLEKRQRDDGTPRTLEVRTDCDGCERWLGVAPSLEEAVIDGAISRAEPLVATFARGEWMILGGLVTRAIPGIDAVESVRIEARTIRLEATERLALVSGSSQILLRAVGSVETLARHITHRASEVQKIIGRMLHLN